MQHEKRVLLAFSGGIDSSAAVEILRSKGYEVEGYTIDMLGDEGFLEQARLSAAMLSLTLHIDDKREMFRQEIIQNFAAEYMAGRTPAPCTLCNTLIKWRLLEAKADELGIYYLATGHYFAITQYEGHHYISRAADTQKDQSYYLWGVEERILKRTLTPMAEQIKGVIKQTSHLKKESMGVCFLSGQPYATFLEKLCGTFSEGDIVNMKGEKVSRHAGIARYTIGQKRGEGLPSGLRVVSIDGEMNTLIVGEERLLHSRCLQLERCYFINAEELHSAEDVSVLVRGLGRNPKGFARVEIRGEQATVRLLDDTAWAAAAGQPVALYRGARLVGGGYLLACDALCEE